MTRTTSYRDEYAETARAVAHAGATDREVAEFLKILERTVHRWKHLHPNFAEALVMGKQAADRRVEQSLYRKATGHSFDVEKIFHHEAWLPASPMSSTYRHRTRPPSSGSKIACQTHIGRKSRWM